MARTRAFGRGASPPAGEAPLSFWGAFPAAIGLASGHFGAPPRLTT
jgi:hypothetical protein